MKKRKKRESLDSFLVRTIARVQDVCSLGDYQLSFILSKKNEEDDGGRGIAASIHIDRRYLTAHITFYPHVKLLYSQKKLTEIRGIVCHELAHIRTGNLFNLGCDRDTREKDLRDEWESLTEHVGRLMYDKVVNATNGNKSNRRSH